jgi:hypothetical protein
LDYNKSNKSDGSDHEEYLKSDDEDSFFGNDFKTKKQSLKDIKNLPEKLFVAIECLLDDINEKVRLAAAITIFTVERYKKTPKAKEKVLFCFLRNKPFLTTQILRPSQF